MRPKGSLEADSTQPFFPLSYLKLTRVVALESTKSFSVHSYAGMMRKSASSQIATIPSVILKSQVRFSLCWS